MNLEHELDHKFTFFVTDFVYGLERDYPSTVSTIARTCGKLTVKDLATSNCVLCSR